MYSAWKENSGLEHDYEAARATGAYVLVRILRDKQVEHTYAGWIKGSLIAVRKSDRAVIGSSGGGDFGAILDGDFDAKQIMTIRSAAFDAKMDKLAFQHDRDMADSEERNQKEKRTQKIWLGAILAAIVLFWVILASRPPSLEDQLCETMRYYNAHAAQCAALNDQERYDSEAGRENP